MGLCSSKETSADEAAHKQALVWQQQYLLTYL